MPGGAPAPAFPPAPPPPPSTYASRFGSAELDPYAGDYTSLYETFSPVALGGAQAPPTPLSLLNRAKAWSGRPPFGGYAVLIPRGGQLMVEVLVNPHDHVDAPGAPPSGYDGVVIAQLGDVRRSRDGYVQVAAVRWPATAFHLAGQGPTTVPTVATFDVVLAAGDPAAGLGPFNQGDPDTEEVRARMCCPLGAGIAAQFGSGPMTPREFWEGPCAYVRADPARAVAAKTVLDFGRLCLLAPAVAGGDRITQLPPLELVDLRDDLLDSVLDLAGRDLPGLRPGADDPMHLVATAMGTLASQQAAQTQRLEQHRREDKADPTPQSLFKGALTSVLRLCEVAREQDLPQIYSLIARAKKADQLTDAQRRLNEAAFADTAYGGTAPILASDTFRRLLEPRWYSHDLDDVGDGVTPFQSVFSSTAQLGIQAKEQQRYRLLLEGNSVLLSELIKTEELAKIGVSVPTDWPQLKRTLMGYYFICSEFLGVAHRITVAVRDSMADAHTRDAALSDHFSKRPDQPILVVRRWQQRLQDFYYRHARAVRYADVAVPDLTSMWFEMVEGSWRPPSLPPHLQGEVLALPTLPTDATVGTTTTATSSLTSATCSVPDGYQLVPVTPKTPRQPAARTGGELVARKGGASQAVVEVAGTGWVSKEVKERFKDTWPRNKKGKLMCLPWHYRGSCYDNCGRAEDHIVHAKEEEQTLCKFLDTNFGEFRKNS